MVIDYFLETNGDHILVDLDSTKAEMRVSLSVKEAELWRAFQAYLNLNKKQTFTVDDLRDYFSEERLKEVFPDRIHDIGLWCLKLMKSGEIRKVGTTYGRYNRAIKMYTTT